MLLNKLALILLNRDNVSLKNYPNFLIIGDKTFNFRLLKTNYTVNKLIKR